MGLPLNDPVSDMLTRLRNGVANNFDEVSLPASKLKTDIAKLLKQAGYLSQVKTTSQPRATLVLGLKDAPRPILNLKRISTPGRRMYVAASDIRAVRGGQGIAIISTSQGLMTGRTARTRRLGGELVCEVY